MKTLTLVVLLSAPAAAGTLESDAAGAAAPFEGLAEFGSPPVVAAEREDAARRALADAGPANARPAVERARPAVAAPTSAPYKRPRTFDDGFMDGFGFVMTPAVELISANMSSCRSLCSGNPAVGVVGYGLGLLLMVPAWAAGLVTAAWWGVFG